MEVEGGQAEHNQPLSDGHHQPACWLRLGPQFGGFVHAFRSAWRI